MGVILISSQKLHVLLIILQGLAVTRGVAILKHHPKISDEDQVYRQITFNNRFDPCLNQYRQFIQSSKIEISL